HSLTRFYLFLRGDLVWRALLEHASGIGVDALGVLADDDEVDVLGLDSFQRAEPGIEQPHRADVGVEVHLEAHAEENLFGVNVGWHAEIAEGSDEDGVEVTSKHGEAIAGDGGTVS